MTSGINEEALDEYQEAARWYEEQRHLLGVEFTEAVEAAIRVIQADPERFQRAGGEVRVFRMKRFPYCIFFRYVPDRDHLRILGIVHNRRRPGVWKKRE
jgi:plasmid stabilization system protein ParE